VQSACQAWAVSSAIRLATGAGAPSASDASRTKARTSSARAPSSTSCSSEKRAMEDVFMGADRPDVVRLVEPPLYGAVLNEV
jgi:hypothetical protein